MNVSISIEHIEPVFKHFIPGPNQDKCIQTKQKDEVHDSETEASKKELYNYIVKKIFLYSKNINHFDSCLIHYFFLNLITNC